MELSSLGQNDVVRDALADVSASRERSRLRRVLKLGVFLAVVASWLWWRVLMGASLLPSIPNPGISEEYLVPILLVGSHAA